MAKDKESFEQSLKRLEEIVEELGRKDVDVEAGLKKFKEGTEIIKAARARLRKSENEFIELKKELEELYDEE